MAVSHVATSEPGWGDAVLAGAAFLQYARAFDLTRMPSRGDDGR